MNNGAIAQQKPARGTARSKAKELLPPHDLQAEKGVLGSLALDHQLLSAVVGTGLTPSDFYDDAHGIIYAGFLALFADGKKIDPTLLIAHLKSTGQYEAVGGSAFVSQTITGVPNAAHAVYYAEIVVEHSRARRLWDLREEIADLVRTRRTSEEIGQHIQQVLELQGRASDADDFELLTCEDVESSPDEEYLAEGLIVKGQPGIIGAPYKGMKTSICCDIVLALATGGSVLGKFDCSRPVKVFFMSGESGLSTLRKTARAICRTNGIEWPKGVPNLKWSRMLPMMGEASDLRRLDRAHRKFPFEVLVIDPTYKAMKGVDASNLMIQGEKLMHLQRWCDANGVTLILVHHLTKPSAQNFRPAELGELSLAGFAEHVRWWLLLSRRQKYVPPDPIHRLWLSVGGSAGHSGLYELDIDFGLTGSGQTRNWGVRLEEADEAERQKKSSKAESRQQEKQKRDEAHLAEVLRVLATIPNGDTKTGIRSVTTLNGTQVSEAIVLGLKRDLIERCEVHKSGKKTGLPSFRLAKTGHRENPET